MRPVFLIILASLLLFSGCKTIEPKSEPVVPLKIPEKFSSDQFSSNPMDGNAYTEKWWDLFDCDELSEFINYALDNNFDLKILKAKIAQEKAELDKENASFFPVFDFSFGGEKKGTWKKESYSGPFEYDGSHSWDTSLEGSYTPDIWGEAKAGKQAQFLTLEAARQDLRGSELDLAAQIAESWIDIIAARNKKIILDNQIKSNKILLELQKLRFVNGKAAALDVSQQKEALSEVNSQFPLLEKQERVLLNSLALLSGKTYVKPGQITSTILPKPLPVPKLGIPSDLLENRPDIRAAQMRLFSGQWDISAARADRLPSFKLTAGALFSSGKLDLLFRNWVATLAGSIAVPVMDGGKRKAEIERLKAVLEQLLNQYAKTLAEAVIEVEDSLVAIDKQEDYIRLLEEELAVARLTLKDAQVQYQNGQSTYLSYLTTWTNIEQLERQLVGERAILIKEGIGLYQALGCKPFLENSIN